MKTYIFQAAMLCEPCARAVMATRQPNEDSDHYPQGPYADGGGEADTPQHCDHCNAFLENPLTPDGAEYVVEAIAAQVLNGEGNRAVVKQWADHYGMFLPDAPMTLAELKAEYRLMADGDDWGNTMAWWFAVAGELYTRNEMIPVEWKYRPGMSPRADVTRMEVFDCVVADTDALHQFGAILTRVAHCLERAGKSY